MAGQNWALTVSVILTLSLVVVSVYGVSPLTLTAFYFNLLLQHRFRKSTPPIAKIYTAFLLVLVRVTRATSVPYFYINKNQWVSEFSQTLMQQM